jgi:hypothetical protein
MHSDSRSNPSRSSESLEARLRALPRPVVPADLEDRLIAAIPAQIPLVRPRWAVWGGVAGTLAAACVLAFLAWPRTPGIMPAPSPPSQGAVHEVASRPPDDDASLAAWPLARRLPEGAETLTFRWPIADTSLIRAGASIPPDLLD